MTCLTNTQFAMLGVVIIVLLALLFLSMLVRSQREADSVPFAPFKLVVTLYTGDDAHFTDVVPCSDLKNAQNLLNMYMLHRIVKASVYNGVSGRLYADMDKNGVLRVRPAE